MRRRHSLIFIATMVFALIGFWRIGLEAESNNGNRTAHSTEGVDTVKANKDSAAATPKVIAYYFHTTYRCASCKKIEAYSREAIETGFVEELKTGILKFESINVDESKYKHYIDDYRLYAKSLIISRLEDGKQIEWKNLTKVWQLLRNKEEFFKYVRDEIGAYLKES